MEHKPEEQGREPAAGKARAHPSRRTGHLVGRDIVSEAHWSIAAWAIVCASIGTAAGALAGRYYARARVRLTELSPTWLRGGIGLMGGIPVGIAAAPVLHDPFTLALAPALGWSAALLVGRLRDARRLLRDTRTATRVLTQVAEEVSVGLDPVASLRRSLEDLPARHPMRRRVAAFLAEVAAGTTPEHAAVAWADREPVPALRMFARLLGAWSVWGLDIHAGVTRILRESRRSVAFGEEEALERRAYEWLTWVFLLGDVAMGVWAVLAWPHSVTPPNRTQWGRALLIVGTLATTLAVALPAALEAGTPEEPLLVTERPPTRRGVHR